jgi:hypothetical protein
VVAVLLVVEVVPTLFHLFTPFLSVAISHKLPSFPFFLSPTENCVALAVGLGLFDLSALLDMLYIFITQQNLIAKYGGIFTNLTQTPTPTLYDKYEGIWIEVS